MRTLSLCVAAMVHQQHEPHRNMADRSHGPSASHISAQDSDQDCEGLYVSGMVLAKSLAQN